MFMHNKRLQYTVRVGETNPALAVPNPQRVSAIPFTAIQEHVD